MDRLPILMTSDRKKPGVAFWATVVVVVLLAYPISFGPACWISSQTGFALRALPIIYRPLVLLMARRIDTEETRLARAGFGCILYSYPDAGFYPNQGLIESYGCLCAPDEWRWCCSAEFGSKDGRTVRLTEDLWEFSGPAK
jgi:hypothetical protein